MAAIAVSLVLVGCQAGENRKITAGNGEIEAPQVGSGTTLAAREDEAPPPSAVPSIVGSAAGTLAGGYLGDRLGPVFGERTRFEAAEAERRALASDAPERWSDPQAQASGEVRPLRDFTDAAGRACREYRHSIRIAGRSDAGSGIACRSSDGSWALVGG
jgi:surface antigen